MTGRIQTTCVEAQLAEHPSLHHAQGTVSFPVARRAPDLASSDSTGLRSWRKLLIQEWGALSSHLGVEGLSQGQKAEPVSLALRLPAGMLVGVHYASSIRISGQWKRTRLLSLS